MGKGLTEILGGFFPLELFFLDILIISSANINEALKITSSKQIQGKPMFKV